VYEVGYRGQPATYLSYSITAFHTIYDHLRTQEIAPSRTFIIFGNEMEGKTSGIEMWGNYQALPAWRLSAGFTALRESLRLKASSNDAAAPNAAGNDPAHTWQARLTWDITPNHELDITLRHVAKLTKNAVPAYTTVDARFGWKLRHDLELSVIGQNLFGRHAEYGTRATRTEITPGIFVKLLWHN
jgi:iron complex outermembrane receptor protein